MNCQELVRYSLPKIALLSCCPAKAADILHKTYPPAPIPRTCQPAPTNLPQATNL
nr:MAG TPA: hypothetical protein [Caudoviricetes sp.]